ncbi:PurA-like adenylosuccinate synthetase [Gordonia phage Ghobes]|uniref:N6-succino-2-amino-2'-deoxyadenylate synthase n=1 Tax=Gordonia phage Ghobes TaxID=1887647 RepID=A0A1B3B082_9CAUD|nr:2-aminooxy adenylosuccinate synthetase [Gordonia phage Ghobes]AOE44401.1 PurA-like adenylosuccinate synthetase [Gordonia phage Ghobes]
MAKLDVVVGAQFGSEAKGRVTLELVQRRRAEGRQVVSVRVGGPNAGHVVWDQGHRFAMRSLPVGFVDPDTLLLVAPGSEVDLEVLREEVELVESHGYSVRDRLWLHPQATYLHPKYRKQEQESSLGDRVGSTAKGIGAARAARVWRTAPLVGDVGEFGELGRVYDFLPHLQDHASDPNFAVVVEGTQGYGLGLHAGYYPQCTSNDARGLDFVAQLGAPLPWDLPTRTDFLVHLVVRPFPIRVAGNSGPLAGETSWAELGVPEERTTVTNKVRRVGQFEPELVAEAVRANGVRNSVLHLSFADQLAPYLEGRTEVSEDFWSSPEADRLQEFLYDLPFSQKLLSLGTGPQTSVWLDSLSTYTGGA